MRRHDEQMIFHTNSPLDEPGAQGGKHTTSGTTWENVTQPISFSTLFLDGSATSMSRTATVGMGSVAGQPTFVKVASSVSGETVMWVAFGK